MSLPQFSTPLPVPIDAAEVLNREFLEVRAKLLQLAATLDRMGRAEGSLEDDPRMQRIQQGLSLLQDGRPDRAERLQMLFSLPFTPAWKQEFGLGKRAT